MLKINDKAPSFDLPSMNGGVNLDGLAGKWVIVYFYPKDNTPGCSCQAKDFRDALNDQTLRDVIVLGVSKDSLDSHGKFRDKYELPFDLLMDDDNAVAIAYGAYGKKKFLGKSYDGTIRSTFLIDPKGNINKTWYDIKASGHVDGVIEYVAQLKQ